MTQIKKESVASFDKEELFNYIKKFSFPRLAGSEGEKKAAELSVKQFKDLGFTEDNIERQKFKFSDFYSTFLIKLIAIINLLFLLLFLLLTYIIVIFSTLILLILLLIILLILRGLKEPEDPGFWGKYYGNISEASNVYAKVPAKDLPEEKAANIIISAHLDSKSQTYTTMMRISSYKVWFLGSVLLGFLYFIKFLLYYNYIKGLDPIYLEIRIWIMTGILAIVSVLLMNLNTYNKSPGALDNASGMAIVFGLSSYFVKHPLKHFNLWFVQFSAEEIGTMGSRIFVKNLENKFEKGKVFQFNIDLLSGKGLGEYNRIEYLRSFGIIPRDNLTSLLGRYLRSAAAKKDIYIYGIHFTTGAHTDSLPFRNRNYDTVDLGTMEATKWAHTTEDTPDKVDPVILKDTCILLKEATLQMDDDYHQLIKK